MGYIKNNLDLKSYFNSYPMPILVLSIVIIYTVNSLANPNSKGNLCSSLLGNKLSLVESNINSKGNLPLIERLAANQLEAVSINQETQLKMDLLEYFNPSIKKSISLFENIPTISNEIFNSAIQFFRAKNDYQFIDQLLSSYVIFKHNYETQDPSIENFIESIDFNFPKGIEFPLGSYDKVYPTIPMIMVSKLRAPIDLYTMDIHLLFSKADNYWVSTLLQSLSKGNTFQKDNAFILSLKDTFNNHPDEYDFYPLDSKFNMIARRSASWRTGANESTRYLFLSLQKKFPNNLELQKFGKTIRTPENENESPENIDINNLTSIRFYSQTPFTISEGNELLKKAIEEVHQTVPKLNHRGFPSSFNWLISRFESDNSKSAVLFPDFKSLSIADQMGFRTKERANIIRRLQKNIEQLIDGKKSLFSFFLFNQETNLPRVDAENNSSLVRLLNGFYKELAGDSNADYFQAPKKMQAWIERLFLAHLFRTGDWPTDIMSYEKFKDDKNISKNLPTTIFNESVQQYLLSTSHHTLLLRYEDGLYFLPGTTPESLRVIGITHQYKDPISYLNAQNNSSKYSMINLHIISIQQFKGYLDSANTQNNGVVITAKRPLLFAAELFLK